MKEAVHVYLDIAFLLFFMLLLWCRIFLILVVVVVVVWLFGFFYVVFVCLLLFFVFFELLREGGYRVLPVLSFILPEEKKKVVRCDVNRKL